MKSNTGFPRRGYPRRHGLVHLFAGLFAGLFVGLVLLYGCTTSPTSSSDTNDDDTQGERSIKEDASSEIDSPLGRRDRSGSTDTEERPLSEPPETPVGDPEKADEMEEEASAAEEWEPPSMVAPEIVPPEQREAIARWVATLPYVLDYNTRRLDPAFSLLLRRYLREATANVRPVDRRVNENVFRVSITPTLIADASAKNEYGATELTIVVRLEGPASPVATAKIEGPWSLSRVSSTDAQLNSLRRIDPETIARVVATLRADVVDELSYQGVPFRVLFPMPPEVDGSIAEDMAGTLNTVFRSIGTPRDSEGVWQFHAPPQVVQRSLASILADSPFGFSIYPLTRDIRIIYNGGS